MATSPRPSGPNRTGEREAIDEQAGSQSYEGSGSSPATPRPDREPCPWRTRQFHDEECARYFDCPSHTLERRTQTGGIDGESSALGVGPGTEMEAHDAHGDAARNLAGNAGILTTDTQSSRERLEASPAESSSATLSGAAVGSAAHGNETRPLPIRTSSLVREAIGGALRRSSSPLPHGTATSVPDMLLSREGPAAPYAPPIIDGHRQLTTRRSQGGPATPRGRPSDDGTTQPRAQDGGSGSPEVALPRWQPDAQVTYCPICHTQFSIFVRKHHCRKCGRVVCNSCSPHRIIIPHQYIVRAPGSEISLSTSLLLDGLGAGYFEASGPSGGERVRLCNPCVPDPNTAPPHSPASPPGTSTPTSHHRSRSSHGSVYGVAHAGNGYGAAFPAGRSAGDAYQYYSSRWRSVTMGPTPHGGSTGAAGHHGRIGATYHAPLDRLLAAGPSSTPAPPRRHRHSSFGDAASSRHRALPPPPQIAEEDECPICHRELPSRELPDFENLRESHIAMCIQAHSTYGSPRAGGGGEAAPHAAPRRTGMYTYAATEKDCVDDAECTICLEEFAVGVPMARLECLCRFHKACISAWFVNHPGRCPVHQHDGFGF